MTLSHFVLYVNVLVLFFFSNVHASMSLPSLDNYVTFQFFFGIWISQFSE